MGVIENFEKVAISTYKTTASKTNKLTKQIKIKLMINEDKEEIEELYNEMGKQIYLNHRLEKIDKNNDEMFSKLKKACYRIDALSDEIDELRMEKLKLNDLKLCDNCYSQIHTECRYCPNCGLNQNKEITKKESYENASDIIEEKISEKKDDDNNEE